MMSIDWFTFVAQIINFLVLVWLLSHFLYRPIIKAMDERQAKISEAQEDAMLAKESLNLAKADLEAKSLELVHAKEELLAEAAHEVQDWKDQAFRDAREEVDRSKQQWYRAISREKETFIRDARTRVATYVSKMSQRILESLADVNLQSLVIERFVEKLNNMDHQQLAKIGALDAESDEQIFVDSAWPLGAADQKLVATLIRDKISPTVEVVYRETPETLLGIELQASGHRFSWSARDHMEQLEDEFLKSLDELMFSETNSEPAQPRFQPGDSSSA